MNDIIVEDVDRDWFCPEEESGKAIKFSYPGRPGYILLAKDKRTRSMYNIHFINVEKLEEIERESLALKVIEFLKPGDYLGTCGIYWPGHELEYHRFSYRTLAFTDTGMIRVLKDSSGNYTVYFPILKRN